MVVIVFIDVGGAEVYTRAAFQGGKEGRGNVGADPVGHPIQLVAGNEVAAAAAAAVHFDIVRWSVSENDSHSVASEIDADKAQNFPFAMIFFALWICCSLLNGHMACKR